MASALSCKAVAGSLSSYHGRGSHKSHAGPYRSCHIHKPVGRRTCWSGHQCPLLGTRHSRKQSLVLAHGPSVHETLIVKETLEEDGQSVEDTSPSADCQGDSHDRQTWTSHLAKRSFQGAVVAAGAALLLTVGAPDWAAAAVQKVGEFTASGFVFKDTVEVMSIDDPAVKGVRIFVSDFKRALPDRLKKDFFNEPSQASISCAQTKALQITDTLGGSDGVEIYSEGKGLFTFKTLRVRRIYDTSSNSLIYIAYSTRANTSDPEKASTGRYRTSMCVIPLYGAAMVEKDNADGVTAELLDSRSARAFDGRREGGATIKGR